MAELNADPQDDKKLPVNTEEEEVEEVEIDTQPIVDDVTKAVSEKLPKADKIAEEVRDGIIEKLTGEKDKEGLSPWEKEKRAPKDYTEVAEWGTEKAKKEIRAEIEEKEKVQAKKTAKEKKATEAKQKEWNDYWDGQVNKLVEEGKIPAVNEDIQVKLAENKALTDEEKEDEGVQARREIFKLANENKESNLELVYYKYYSKGATKPAGATAPVFGSRKVVSPSGKGEEYSYDEIHGAKTMRDLLPKT